MNRGGREILRSVPGERGCDSLHREELIENRAILPTSGVGSIHCITRNMRFVEDAQWTGTYTGSMTLNFAPTPCGERLGKVGCWASLYHPALNSTQQGPELEVVLCCSFCDLLTAPLLSYISPSSSDPLGRHGWVVSGREGNADLRRGWRALTRGMKHRRNYEVRRPPLLRCTTPAYG